MSRAKTRGHATVASALRDGAAHSVGRWRAWSRTPGGGELGVDAVWITPWYPSPQADGGYDVADYRAIDPLFGTLPDAEKLLAEAHARGLKVLLDVVPNHTSDQHEWFRAALAGGPGSSARSRYMFRPGRGGHGERPPNNWTSAFGGPAWTRVPDGEWHLHLLPSVPFDRPMLPAHASVWARL